MSWFNLISAIMRDPNDYFDYHKQKGRQIIISINPHELLEKLKGVGFWMSVCGIVCVHCISGL